MKRRTFLQSLLAAGVAPLVPGSVFSSASAAVATAGGAGTVAGPMIPMGTYKWAETIVRAHRTCNLAFLQRHLKVEAGMARVLQQELIRNGVITAQANAYGLHKATKPLFEGAVPKPANANMSVDHALDEQTQENCLELAKINISQLYERGQYEAGIALMAA